MSSDDSFETFNFLTEPVAPTFAPINNVMADGSRAANAGIQGQRHVAQFVDYPLQGPRANVNPNMPSFSTNYNDAERRPSHIVEELQRRAESSSFAESSYMINQIQTAGNPVGIVLPHPEQRYELATEPGFQQYNNRHDIIRMDGSQVGGGSDWYSRNDDRVPLQKQNNKKKTIILQTQPGADLARGGAVQPGHTEQSKRKNVVIKGWFNGSGSIARDGADDIRVQSNTMLVKQRTNMTMVQRPFISYGTEGDNPAFERQFLDRALAAERRSKRSAEEDRAYFRLRDRVGAGDETHLTQVVAPRSVSTKAMRRPVLTSFRDTFRLETAQVLNQGRNRPRTAYNN